MLRWRSRDRFLGGTVVSGSSGSPEYQECLSAAEFLGTGAGKLAAISEPRNGLSSQGCHEPKLWHSPYHCSLSRGPASSRTSKIPLLPLQKSTGFGGSKQGGAPEIGTVRHRLREHRVPWETRETEGWTAFP